MITMADEICEYVAVSEAARYAAVEQKHVMQRTGHALCSLCYGSADDPRHFVDGVLQVDLDRVVARYEDEASLGEQLASRTRKRAWQSGKGRSRVYYRKPKR